MTISGTANGTVSPRRPAVSTALFAVCASFACEAAEPVAPPARDTRAGAVPDAVSTTKASGSAAQNRLDPPKASVPLTMTRELFDRKTWDTQDVAAAAPQQESRSSSPPFRYQYVGRMEVEGRLTVHLSKDDRLYPVRIGDVLDGTFRVEGIKADGLELTYLPSKRKQFVAFSTIAPPSPPQTSVAARPEAAPQQQPMATGPVVPPGIPGESSPPGASNVANTPAAGNAGSAAPIGGSPSTPPGSPTSTPSVGSAPVAPSSAPPGQTAPGATTMPILPPTAEMPVEPPTVSTMPTLPPGRDMPVAPPSGSTMVTTPPSGGM